MDRAEAVKILEIQLDVTEVNTPSCIKLHEALDLAIEALGQPRVVYCRNCKHSTDTGDYQDTYFCDNPHHDSNHLVHSLEYCSHGKPKEKLQPTEETSSSEGDAESATTTDCISRADTIKDMCAECWCKDYCGGDCTEVKIVKSMPPVTPKEQTDCTDFIKWLLEEVLDEENWELNAVANGEIICRKLKKLGLLEVKDGYYYG